MATKTPIGLQLFSVRGEVNKSLPETLKQVAAIGYEGVEPWGYGGDKLEWMGWTPQDIRRMLDDQGLTCCGIHLATAALLGDNLQRTIELNQILGSKFLIIAADKQRMSALDTIQELADILNQTAEVLAPLGMAVGYHAHPFDFVKFGDETAWEILFSNTRDEVIMQLDIGNCANGGGDPIAMLRKFPGRARSLHLKARGRGVHSAPSVFSSYSNGNGLNRADRAFHRRGDPQQQVQSPSQTAPTAPSAPVSC